MADDFILTMVQNALAEVANRTEGRDRQGHRILTQADIDRVPPTYLWGYTNQRMGQVMGNSNHQPRPRSWWERVRGRWQP